LIETFVARGEREWPCSICFHDNLPSKKECVMCGTPQQVVVNPNLPRASGLHKSDFAHPAMKHSRAMVLDQQSRIRSFHVRRLKQMNLTARQKAAMRRHLWRRKKGPDGQMHWLRIDADENDQTRESTLDMYDMSEPKESSDRFDILSPVSDTQSSIAEEDMYEAHVALAMRDLGFDENDKAPFRPLRETALKQLEEAEVRHSMCPSGHELPPHANGGNAGVGFGYGKGQIQLPFPKISEEDRRMNEMNFTTLSTGYVRHENADGGMEFAPAMSVNVGESRQPDCDDDLEEIAAMTFHEKNKWFMAQVQKRWRNYAQGHIQFVIRRSHLVEDSKEQMLKCPASRFWERLRIFFENEPGLDAGGLIREWYELLCDALFNEEMGLFIAKGSNVAYWINPASKSKLGERHLEVQTTTCPDRILLFRVAHCTSMRSMILYVVL
jgi:hypothetical protein